MIGAKLPSCAVSTYRVPLSSNVEGRDVEYVRQLPHMNQTRRLSLPPEQTKCGFLF